MATSPMTFTTDAALETLDDDLTFTLSVLRTFVFASVLVKQYETTIARCETLVLEQRRLQRAIVHAQGLVSAADARLDAIVDKVDLAVQVATDKTPGHPLRKLFFRNIRVSDLKRPVLGSELDTMRPWPKELAESGIASLVALAPMVAEAIAAADAAIAALADAQNANRVFRLTGPRKVVIDDTNALRGATFGFLKEYQYAHPELNLPTDFASSAFRRTRKAARQTPEDLDIEIATVEANLDTLRGQRSAHIAQQEAEVKTRLEGETKAAELTLAEAQKATAEALKRVEELKGKLPPAAPSPPPDTH
jgi:hypothetical protein